MYNSICKTNLLIFAGVLKPAEAHSFNTLESLISKVISR